MPAICSPQARRLLKIGMAFRLRLAPLLLLLSLACAGLVACEEGARAIDNEAASTESRPAKLDSTRRGKQLMAHYQCTACHAIPDVPGQAGGMGPPLNDFGQRSYIAGHIPNEAGNLAKWLRAPSALVPGTAMPDMGVSDADARDMAAYLLSLK